MSKNLVDVSTYDTTIVVPVDADARNAPSVETALQSLANRSLNIANRCGGAGTGLGEFTYEDGARTRVVFVSPFAFAQVSRSAVATAPPAWTGQVSGAGPTQGMHLESNENGAELHLDLSIAFPRATIKKVRARVHPGAVRATAGDRSRISIFAAGSVFVGDGVLPTYTGPQFETTDDGTNILKTIDTGTITKILVPQAEHLHLMFRAGIDAGTNTDLVYGFEITIEVPGPGGIQ